MTPMKSSSPTKPWCVQLKASFSADRRRKTKYFRTKEEAEKFCVQVRKFGISALHDFQQKKAAKDFEPQVLEAINRLGGDPAKLWEAIRDYERNRLSVKPIIVNDALDEFALSRKKKVSNRTWKGDNWQLSRLARQFGNSQLSELIEADLRRFFDKLPGHTRSIYKTVKVFFRWAREYNYVAINPMDGIRPTEDWGVRKGIYAPSTFERMLRISAGLEGPLPGELPTKRFLSLLPWFALSGFTGLRSCEAYPTDRQADAIRWDDLRFDREPPFIEIRDSVAKRTRKNADGRFIESPVHLEALKAWLDLLPEENSSRQGKSGGKSEENSSRQGFVVPVRSRMIEKLKSEFTRVSGIKFVENGFRNSFASYALTADGLQGVGRLALEMGNSEAIAKKHYIKTLEPRTGKAWFSLRPEGPANIVAINAA